MPGVQKGGPPWRASFHQSSPMGLADDNYGRGRNPVVPVGHIVVERIVREVDPKGLVTRERVARRDGRTGGVIVGGSAIVDYRAVVGVEHDFEGLTVEIRSHTGGQSDLAALVGHSIEILRPVLGDGVGINSVRTGDDLEVTPFTNSRCPRR